MASRDTTFVSTGTLVIPLFKVTGTILVNALYGVVTTALAANHRASSFRLNDQTAVTYLTAIGGTTLDSASVGSVIIKDQLAAAAVTLLTSAARAVLEPTTVQTQIFTPTVLVQKNGIETDIEYRFTSSTNPTTGAMTFFCGYIPLSPDGNLSVL
jgi:phage baseplate assembly protein gpV